MKCPECGGKPKIINSRLHAEELGADMPLKLSGIAKQIVRRRHVCKECGHRFGTVELTDEDFFLARHGLETMQAHKRRFLGEAIKKLLEMND